MVAVVALDLGGGGVGRQPSIVELEFLDLNPNTPG